LRRLRPGSSEGAGETRPTRVRPFRSARPFAAARPGGNLIGGPRPATRSSRVAGPGGRQSTPRSVSSASGCADRACRRPTPTRTIWKRRLTPGRNAGVVRVEWTVYRQAAEGAMGRSRRFAHLRVRHRERTNERADRARGSRPGSGRVRGDAGRCGGGRARSASPLVAPTPLGAGSPPRRRGPRRAAAGRGHAPAATPRGPQ
jgi:hypothetical protein